MRWLGICILTGLVLILQSTLAPRLAVATARPDWALAVVVMLAMHARGVDALVAAALIGWCADMTSIERLGVHAIPYTMVAWLIVSSREALFRRAMVTQAAVTLLAALSVQACWLVYRAATDVGLGNGLVGACGLGVLASLYTAIWAPPIHAAAKWFPGAVGKPGPGAARAAHAG